MPSSVRLVSAMLVAATTCSRQGRGRAGRGAGGGGHCHTGACLDIRASRLAKSKRNNWGLACKCWQARSLCMQVHIGNWEHPTVAVRIGLPNPSAFRWSPAWPGILPMRCRGQHTLGSREPSLLASVCKQLKAHTQVTCMRHSHMHACLRCTTPCGTRGASPGTPCAAGPPAGLYEARRPRTGRHSGWELSACMTHNAGSDPGQGWPWDREG